MADELLCCPACKRKLRIPDTQFGWIVKCPLCGAVFRAPLRVPPPGAAPGGPSVVEERPPVEPAPVERPAVDRSETPADADAEAEDAASMHRIHRALLVPGLVLLIQSVLTLVQVTVPVLKGPAELAAFWQVYLDDEAAKRYPEEWVAQLREAAPAELSGLAAFLAVGTIIGAIHILRLKRYPLALLGSGMIMVNVFYPGCTWWVNWLLGMWAILTLRSPEVRAAFD